MPSISIPRQISERAILTGEDGNLSGYEVPLNGIYFSRGSRPTMFTSLHSSCDRIANAPGAGCRPTRFCSAWSVPSGWLPLLLVTAWSGCSASGHSLLFSRLALSSRPFAGGFSLPPRRSAIRGCQNSCSAVDARCSPR
jgi:hypothetical protein